MIVLHFASRALLVDGAAKSDTSSRNAVSRAATVLRFGVVPIERALLCGASLRRGASEGSASRRGLRDLVLAGLRLAWLDQPKKGTLPCALASLVVLLVLVVVVVVGAVDEVSASA